nr:hypothetical protein [Tanacetum cinerariifolium]
DSKHTPRNLERSHIALKIEGHLSALKSIIKDHNRRNKTDPICLDFEGEDTEARDNCILKGKEVVDDDLKKP